MVKRRKESFFWTSYSDLMTSMFFIMLVLFVLVIALLHNKQKATEQQLKKITEIENAVNKIDTKYFEYNKEYKKHILKINVNFKSESSNINDIPATTLEKLEDAGKVISSFIREITSEYNIKYLLIIEGQASKDNYQFNYELSYKRALSLRNYWEAQGVTFGDNCEVLISGSGTGGTMRYNDDNEVMNQRFLIHIVPKPGIIEASKL